MVAYRKLSQHTGAEIIGVDLSKNVTANDAIEIYKVFLDHCLVVFRDQALSQEDLVRITGLFGKCAKYDRPVELQSETQRKTLQQVMLITNIRQDGKPIGALPDGEMWFHHDMIHSELPHKATLLYSVEVPTWGGNTLFSNLYAAYDALAPELKTLLQGRRALNAFNYGSRFKGDPEGLTTRKQAVHPALYRHEETGRTAIYIDRLMTHSLLGLPEAESDAILEQVCDHIERDEFVYEHEWRKGDLLMWDNRSSIHARKDFPADQVRLMWRTTLMGDVRPE
jgi:taurine dioxygenase